MGRGRAMRGLFLFLGRGETAKGTEGIRAFWLEGVEIAYLGTIWTAARVSA